MAHSFQKLSLTIKWNEIRSIISLEADGCLFRHRFWMPLYSLFIGPSHTLSPASITQAGQIPDGSQPLYCRKMWAVEKKPVCNNISKPCLCQLSVGGRAYKEAWTGWEPCLMQTCPLSHCGSWGGQRWSSAVSTEPRDPCVRWPDSAGTAECGAKGPGCGTEDNGVSLSSRTGASFLWTAIFLTIKYPLELPHRHVVCFT